MIWRVVPSAVRHNRTTQSIPLGLEMCKFGWHRYLTNQETENGIARLCTTSALAKIQVPKIDCPGEYVLFTDFLRVCNSLTM